MIPKEPKSVCCKAPIIEELAGPEMGREACGKCFTYLDEYQRMGEKQFKPLSPKYKKHLLELDKETEDFRKNFLEDASPEIPDGSEWEYLQPLIPSAESCAMVAKIMSDAFSEAKDKELIVDLHPEEQPCGCIKRGEEKCVYAYKIDCKKLMAFYEKYKKLGWEELHEMAIIKGMCNFEDDFIPLLLASARSEAKREDANILRNILQEYKDFKDAGGCEGHVYGVFEEIEQRILNAPDNRKPEKL